MFSSVENPIRPSKRLAFFFLRYKYIYVESFVNKTSAGLTSETNGSSFSLFEILAILSLLNKVLEFMLRWCFINFWGKFSNPFIITLLIVLVLNFLIFSFETMMSFSKLILLKLISVNELPWFSKWLAK